MTKIVLDFDDTLFDTMSLIKEWQKRLEEIGFDLDRINKEITSLIPAGFALEKHVKVLGIGESIGHEMIKSFKNWIKNNGSSLVYTDVLPFLRKIKDDPTYILTHGDKKFQQEKIRHSGLTDLIHGVWVSSLEKPKSSFLTPLSQGSQSIVFIDDNPLQLEEVAKAQLAVRLFRINRPNGYHSKIKHELDGIAWQVVESLNDVRSLIEF